MQKGQHPNKLRALLAFAGLTVRETACEAQIPEGTLRHYAAGDQVIPRRDREKLAQVIGCDVQDLAPLSSSDGSAFSPTPRMREASQDRFAERNGCFSFGRLKTTWKMLDGDGVGHYLPQNIRSHYIAVPEELPEELQRRKSAIQQEQERKREQGLPSHWNGDIYSLDRFVIGRDPSDEAMTLDLWFRPSDYFTFLATNMGLKEPEMREKYLSGVDWDEPVPYFSHSFGVSLAVVTSDGYTLFTRRGKHVGILPSTYETSVAEGLSRPIDRGTSGDAPDVYRCACRGLAEELGLQEGRDFSISDILFLNFGVSTQYGLWALRGMVKIRKTVHDLVTLWDNGVRDKFENQEILPVSFTVEDIVAFVFEHPSLSLKPTIYHVLVHEFRREHVEAVLASY